MVPSVYTGTSQARPKTRSSPDEVGKDGVDVTQPSFSSRDRGEVISQRHHVLECRLVHLRSGDPDPVEQPDEADARRLHLGRFIRRPMDPVQGIAARTRQQGRLDRQRSVARQPAQNDDLSAGRIHQHRRAIGDPNPGLGDPPLDGTRTVEQGRRYQRRTALRHERTHVFESYHPSRRSLDRPQKAVEGSKKTIGRPTADEIAATVAE